MPSTPMTDGLTISVDAMGGDRGPTPVIGALNKIVRKEPALRFLLHGPQEVLAPLVKRNTLLASRVEVRHAPRVVQMTDKPSNAVRAAEGTSMWSALGAVADGQADATVSSGNTGALMAMAAMRLRRAKGVDRPAIAVFWPADTESGFHIALDMGAHLAAAPETLQQYAVMGAEYARVGLGIERPRVGLLNVGSEDTKGRPELREARELVAAAAAAGGFEPVGFVEGGDLFTDQTDVIVTDGFTGNIALKTAEGAASFIGGHLRGAFRHNWLSRAASLAAAGPLLRLKRKIDPRRVNGGVFLGLGGSVVKSHGGADATGVSAAISLAARMASTGFADRIARRLADVAAATKPQAAAQ